MNFKSVLPAAVFAVSLVLTSCGGAKTGGAAPITAADDGFEDRTSPLDVLQEACDKVRDTEFCGVGEGTSTKQQMARDVAAAAARNQAVTSIKVEIESALKTSGMNSINDEAAETTFSRISQKVSGTFSNLTISETKNQFNKAENKYRYYVRVSVKKEDVFKEVKKELSDSKVISDAVTSKVLMDIIDAQLDKE